MTETSDRSNLPQAERVEKKKNRVSAIWIIPIIAALVGLGIAVQRILSEGPEIRITFQNGEGIESGKTVIKYKDIEIGLVKDVRLSKDRSKIVVTAEMEKSVEDMLDRDARFWIVKPRVTMSGISGIGALITGNYIGFEPGKSAEKKREFLGMESPPPVRRDRPGREFVLRSATLGSLGQGSPVYFRRLAVGEVAAYDLAKGGQSVEIRIFVNAPYDKFVTSDTRFWEASGLDVSAGAAGISVKTESVTALLVGGIAFETPSDQPGREAKPNTVFPLFKERSAALAPNETEVTRFVLNFHETLHGLSVGAPVALLGLPVGEVSSVGIRYNKQKRAIQPLVEISIYKYRVEEYIDKSTREFRKEISTEERNEIFQRMVVDKGLRAQLRTGSLLSGQLYVGLDYFPDAAPARIDWKKDPPEFPVVPSGRIGLEEKVRTILAKLEKVPMEEIGQDVRKAVASLDNTLQSANRALDSLDRETLPEAKRTMEELRRTMDSADRLLSNADNAYMGQDSQTRRELSDALKELTRAARSFRDLAETLDRNPESLIRGKQKENP